MAQRLNYVEYAFATRTTALALATRHDFSAITVDIAENSSRTFRRVWLEFGWRGTETSATSLTSWLTGIKIDAVAFSDTTVTNTIANSGDQQAEQIFRSGDLSSYFTTNYTGTSHSVQAALQIGALGTINLWCKLCVAYEFDDASQTTRTKTARIPIESGTATLTATLAEIGTWQLSAIVAAWQTFTADNTTDTFTCTAHGYSNGMMVVFQNSGGALPGNLITNPDHKFIIAATANTFQVSSTRGGSAFNISSDGTGTNQVSHLHICPESSISVKDDYLDLFCSEGHVSGTTDDQLGLQINAEGETLFGSLEQALDSSPFMRILWKRTDIATNTPHVLNARGTTTGRLPQLGGYRVITYTYDHSAATPILNSRFEPLPTEVGAMGGTSAGDQSKIAFVMHVPEPGTITLMQSAVMLTYNVGNIAVSGLNVSVGSQTHRTYTPQTANASPAGQHTLVHRLDGAGAAGVGIALVRGENTLTLGWYRTSTGAGGAAAGVSWMVCLNYWSGKASAGANAHTRTIPFLVGATAAIGTNRVFDYTAFAPVIPESLYFCSSVGFSLDIQHAGPGMMALAAERLSGEGVADGREDLGVVQHQNSNEIGTFSRWIDATQYFDRHPDELDTRRLALEGSRVYRISSWPDPAGAHVGWTSLVMYVTYHALTFTDASTVTGYAGDGSGITVHVHRNDTGEELYRVTTATGGTYTVTGYDDTVALFDRIEQDSTHVGASISYNLS
jgi:hypothetical protein